ncbi:hypothetical protein Ancab_024179 [Ancistrocladus abbreviatus]
MGFISNEDFWFSSGSGDNLDVKFKGKQGRSNRGSGARSFGVGVNSCEGHHHHYCSESDDEYLSSCGNRRDDNSGSNRRKGGFRGHRMSILLGQIIAEERRGPRGDINDGFG